MTTPVSPTPTPPPAPPTPAPPPAPAAEGNAPEPSAGLNTAPAATGAPEGAAAATPQVPDTYTFALPAGIELAEHHRDKISSVFRAAGLSQEAADTLLAAQFEVAREREAALDAQFQEDIVAAARSLRADPDVGGPDHDAKMQRASTVLRKYFPPDTVQQLVDLGLHVDKGIVTGFLRLAQTLGEDTFVPPERATTPPKSDEERLRAMYPNSPALFQKT